MAHDIFNAAKSKKKLVTIKNADHGLSYVVDPEYYVNEFKEFLKDSN